MAEVTLKRSEIVNLVNAKTVIGNNGVPVSTKFAYALARTGRHLKDVVGSIQEASSAPSSVYETYARKCGEEGADKEALAGEYAEAIADEEKRVEDWKDLLGGEVTVTVHMVDFEEVPDLPAGVFESLVPMIREPKEEEAA